MSETPSSSIAVVGAGPGGYAAAFLAVDLGMQVTLIDPEVNPGGVCLYRGCIPSKALLHVAKLIEESQQANWGIEFPAPKIDLARLRSWKEGVVKKLTGGLGLLSKQRHVEYIQGHAAFENSNTLRISKADATEVVRSFDRIILATGSRPAIIPALKLDSPRMMDSTGALNLEDIPPAVFLWLAADTLVLSLVLCTLLSGRASPWWKCCGITSRRGPRSGSSVAQAPGENV